jgi:phosphoglycerate dehydrogenase-like enzyme
MHWRQLGPGQSSYLLCSTVCSTSAATADAGKTMGIVGYGDIGRLAKAFKMRVIALRRRSQMSEADREDGVLDAVYSSSELEQLVAGSDYVVMATPFTDATHKLFGARAIAAMQPHAVFVNVGRGKCVDEPALIQALQDGACLAANGGVHACCRRVRAYKMLLQQRAAVLLLRISAAKCCQYACAPGC